MEKKLIKGKWYKFLAQNEILYMKFNIVDCNNVVISLEYISSKNVHTYGGNFNRLGYYSFMPINISEIAHLLPKNHPDLQNKIYEVW